MFPRGLFDWNIASLEATITVLELASKGNLTKALNDVAAFSVAYDALIVNEHLAGFSFFHEDAPTELLEDANRLAEFKGKLTHLAAPFTAPQTGRHTHLVWSNVQPNLPDTVENVIPWEDFILTQDRYNRVSDLGRKIFGADTSFSFLSTPQDVMPDMAGRSNVHIIDLPRGEDYRGEPDLYAQLLSKHVQPTA